MHFLRILGSACVFYQYNQLCKSSSGVEWSRISKGTILGNHLLAMYQSLLWPHPLCLLKSLMALAAPLGMEGCGIGDGSLPAAFPRAFHALGTSSRDKNRSLCWVLGSAALPKVLAAVTSESSASLFASLQMESICSTKCFSLPEARLCIREMFLCFDKQLNVACFKKRSVLSVRL